MNRYTIPAARFSDLDHGLSIPKLGLQYLTIHDYLLRNFTLFRLETAHQIRQDIQEAVAKLSPKYFAVQDKTVISGYARMALSITKVSGK